MATYHIWTIGCQMNKAESARLESLFAQGGAQAVSAGYYHSPLYDKDYPKIQILTIEELLQDKTVDMPPQSQTSIAFPKAARVKVNKPAQGNMIYGPAINPKVPKVRETEGSQLYMGEADRPAA